MSLENVPLGDGTISVRIGAERKFNINALGPEVLSQSLVAAAGSIPSSLRTVILDSLMDWVDPDIDTRVNGADEEAYLVEPNLPLLRPYLVKNGPLDDISELLLIRGITPELYYGMQEGFPTPTHAHGHGVWRFWIYRLVQHLGRVSGQHQHSLQGSDSNATGHGSQPGVGSHRGGLV